MELYQVKYFLALCETLNFTRAADKCAVSQPSLTRAIQNLEGEFGGPLFHRERQRTHLTELGRLMQPYFEQVYAHAQAAKDAAKSFAKLDDISLKIGVMCTIGPSMLADFFGRFRDRHPGVEVQFLDAAGHSLREMLLDGSIEVAIYGLPEGIEERFHAMPLFKERFVIVCSSRRCNLTSGNSVGEEVLRHTGCSDCGEGRPDVADPGYDRGRSHGTAHRRRLGWDGTGVHDAVQSRHAPGAGALPRGRAVRTQPRSARLRQRLQEQDARHHGRDGDRRRTQGRGN